MEKKVLILAGSPRTGGNSDLLCDAFAKKWTLPLAIWVAYTYLSPVVSIAPSSYILFQNIVNSWQLWQRETGRL